MTQAIILAAGQGSRCRPLTDSIPKCLLSFAGFSLLQHQQHALVQNNVHDITVVGGYLNHKISELGYSCIVNTKYQKTNMVYSLLCAKSLFNGNEDVVISYGDIIYQASNLFSLLNTKGDIVVMSDLSWQSYWSQRFGDVLSDAESFITSTDGHVIELGLPVTDISNIQGQFCGLIKVSIKMVPLILHEYEKLLLDKLNLNKNMNLFMTDYLQHLINKGYVIEKLDVNRGWLEFDTVNDVNLYNHWLKDQTLSNQFEVMQCIR